MKDKINLFIKRNILIIVPAIIFLQAFILVLFTECISFYDFDIPYRWVDFDNLYYIFYNTSIYFLLGMLIFCGTKRLLPGYVMLSVFVTIFSIINNMKWNQLKECVSFADLSKLSEAVNVGKGVEFMGVPRLVLGLFALVVFGLLLGFFDIKGLKKRKNALKDMMHSYRFIALIFSILFIIFVRIDWNKNAMDRITENRTADITGPAVYFLESVEKVLCEDEYSVEQAMDSYNKYEAIGEEYVHDKIKASKIHPNVIVVMSEAFYDVNKLKGAVSYSKDPMTFYNKIADESISGSVAANIYGGSTHYSEFEFLTGWNTRGMSLGSCPYKEYFDEFQPSVVKYFEDAGYYTMAVHPYEKWFWNREGAYDSMGFDCFIGREDMKYTDMCGYISDESLTKEIIYRYENRNKKDEPVFLFAVSMANHIARINDDYKRNSPEQINVEYGDAAKMYSPAKKQLIKYHVSGMEKTGEALKELTDYYREIAEPTVIVFFGDHAPSYAAEVLKAGNLDKNEAYYTPFLIWSNYDMENAGSSVTDDLITDENGEKIINVSCLSTYMLEKIGMPLPRQGYYNLGAMKEYPVETRYIIKSASDTPFENYSKEQKKAYVERAKELKGNTDTLLKNTENVKNIWNYDD